MITTRVKDEVLWDKSVPQVPCGLFRGRSRSSSVSGRQLSI